MFAENESLTPTRYKILHRNAKRGKQFTGGNKECIIEEENDLCHEKTLFVWKCQHFRKFRCVLNRGTWRENGATYTRVK